MPADLHRGWLVLFILFLRSPTYRISVDSRSRHALLDPPVWANHGRTLAVASELPASQQLQVNCWPVRDCTLIRGPSGPVAEPVVGKHADFDIEKRVPIFMPFVSPPSRAICRT